MTNNVVTEIVMKNLCIGCGVCAGLCPFGALSIVFNKYGELNPQLTGHCNDACTLCLDICPFFSKNPDENSLAMKAFGSREQISRSEICGFYKGAFVGYSLIGDHRKNGSSGGIATWLLETILKQGIADYAVCVSVCNDPHRFFSFSITSSISTVRDSARSAYYPVDLSDALRFIIKTPGRYAVTALPCFAKALRLAMLRRTMLRERITAIIGLVCGQLKSDLFARYVAGCAGMQTAPQQVNFRCKDTSRRANDFYFSYKSGSENKKIYFKDKPLEAWANGWFTPNACRFCDDIYAELADITVMDAWLPEYTEDPEGTSLIISRSRDMDELIKDGKKRGELILNPISIDDVIRSQGAVIEYKRRWLAYRLYRFGRKDQPVIKRVIPHANLGITVKIRSLIRDVMQEKSRALAPYFIHDGIFNASAFRRNMFPYLFGAKIIAISVSAANSMIHKIKSLCIKFWGNKQ